MFGQKFFWSFRNVSVESGKNPIRKFHYYIFTAIPFAVISFRLREIATSIHKQNVLLFKFSNKIYSKYKTEQLNGTHYFLSIMSWLNMITTLKQAACLPNEYTNSNKTWIWCVFAKTIFSSTHENNAENPNSFFPNPYGNGQKKIV